MIPYWLYFVFPWLLWLAALAARIWAAKVVAPFLSTPLLVITGILLLVVTGAGVWLRRYSVQLQQERSRTLEGRLYLAALPEGEKAPGTQITELFRGLSSAFTVRPIDLWRGQGLHFVCEITRTEEDVGTYIWVPKGEETAGDLQRIVATQLRAAYPSAAVQLVDDPLAQIGDTVLWADLRLAQNSTLPLRTEFTKGTNPVRNIMQTLAAGPGIRMSGVQILLYPSGAGQLARRAGREIRTIQNRWLKAKQRGRGRAAPMSPRDKEKIAALEAKRDAGAAYQVVLRVWIAGSDEKLMGRRLNELVQAYGGLYSAFNRFRQARSGREPESITGRFIPPFAPQSILTPDELSVLYHLPDKEFPMPDVRHSPARSLPPKPRMIEGRSAPPEKFCTFGIHRYVDGSGETRIGVPWLELSKHCFIDGPTGTGKSTMLVNIVLRIMRNPDLSCIVLDPHSKLVYDIIAVCPPEREQDLILVDFADPRRVVGLNLLENIGGLDSDKLASALMDLLERVLGGFEAAPRMTRLLRNMLLTLMEVLDDATMYEFLRMFADEEYREWIVAQFQGNPVLSSFWDMFEVWSKSERNSALQTPLSRLERFLTNPSIQRILTQGTTSLNFRWAMDNHKIVLCDLGTSKLQAENSDLLGALLMTKIRMDAMSRLLTPQLLAQGAFPQVIFVIDEAHRFLTTRETETILSESRKALLSLLFASQYLNQFPDFVQEAIRGNVGTFMAYRLGDQDARTFASQFGVTANDLTHIPQYEFYLRNQALVASGAAFKPPPERED